MEKTKDFSAWLKRQCLFIKYWLKAGHYLKDDEVREILQLDKSGNLFKRHLLAQDRLSYVPREVTDEFLDLDNGKEIFRLYLERMPYGCRVANEKVFELEDLADLLKKYENLDFSDELQEKMLTDERFKDLIPAYIDTRWLSSTAECTLMLHDSQVVRKYLERLGKSSVAKLYPESQIAMLKRADSEEMMAIYCKHYPLEPEAVKAMMEQPNADKLLKIYYDNGYLLYAAETILLLNVKNHWELIEFQMQHGAFSDAIQRELFNSEKRQEFLDSYLSTGKHLSEKIQLKLFEEPNASILIRRYLKNAGGKQLSEKAAVKLFDLLTPKPYVVRFLQSGGIFKSAEQVKAAKMRDAEIPYLLVRQELCDMALQLLMSEYKGEDFFDAYRKNFPISENIRKIAISKGWM